MLNKIIMLLHKETGCAISECQKAVDIAMQYIRLRNPVAGDHIDSFVPNEYELVKRCNLLSYHGRLSDMDELVKTIVKEYSVNNIHELPQDIKMFYDKFINSAPTILDATLDYKLKNYAFLESEAAND